MESAILLANPRHRRGHHRSHRRSHANPFKAGKAGLGAGVGYLKARLSDPLFLVGAGAGATLVPATVKSLTGRFIPASGRLGDIVADSATIVAVYTAGKLLKQDVSRGIVGGLLTGSVVKLGVDVFSTAMDLIAGRPIGDIAGVGTPVNWGVSGVGTPVNYGVGDSIGESYDAVQYI